MDSKVHFLCLHCSIAFSEAAGCNWKSGKDPFSLSDVTIFFAGIILAL